MAEGKLLLVIHLNFLIPTSLQSSGSAITTSGCLPMWNLKTKHSLVLCFYNIYNNKKKRKKKNRDQKQWKHTWKWDHIWRQEERTSQGHAWQAREGFLQMVGQEGQGLFSQQSKVHRDRKQRSLKPWPWEYRDKKKTWWIQCPLRFETHHKVHAISDTSCNLYSS